MSDKKTSPIYVITGGDEGVQINEGTRLAFIGSGVNLPGFSEAVKILKKLLDSKLRIVATEENDWIKQQLKANNWQEANELAQQKTAALAKDEGLMYAGYLPFADPKKLKYGVKGHMVRPKQVHIGTKICFTLGGGEQTYNLGHYQICADWVSEAPLSLVKQVVQPQVDFFQELAKKDLGFVVETAGALGEETATKNLQILAKLGIKPE